MAEDILKLPKLGFGASPLAAIYGAVDALEIEAAVSTAINNGANFFDVAPYYGAGKAEVHLGRLLVRYPRSSYILATKIGRYGARHWNFSRDATLRSFEASLERLATDSIDLLQCHDIEHGDERSLIEETLPALRALKECGAIRAIGVTGYDLEMLESVAVEQKLDAIMAFCFTLQDRRLGRTAKRLQAQGIKVINASPLGMGLLVDQPPPNWHPATDAVKKAAAQAADICRQFGTDLASVALKFALSDARSRGIDSTVVGMRSVAEVASSLELSHSRNDPKLLTAVQQAFQNVLDEPWPHLVRQGAVV